MAKNPELQCTRLKLFIQPATLETEKHRFSLLLKASPFTKNEDFLIKKPVRRKIIENLGSVLCQFIHKLLRFSLVDRHLIRQN